MTAEERKAKNDKANKKAAEQRASVVKFFGDAYKKDKIKRDKIKADNANKKSKDLSNKVKPKKTETKTEAKRATDKGGREGARGSKGFKPQSLADQKISPPYTKKATTNKATTNKAPIVSKKQLKDSGFTNLRDYMNDKQGKTRRDNKAPVKVKDNKSNFKPTKTNIGADMSTVNKPKATPKKSLIDRVKNTAGINRPATAKEQRGLDLQRNARKSMGMKKGGMLKAAPNKGVTKLPQSVRNNMGFMKKGGRVKKCRMDGIALRGKTRAKERSK